MNDFISREAAIKVLCDACGNAACPKGLIPRCSYYKKMQSISAADVQPVKRGKWKRVALILNRSVCSNCSWRTDEIDTFDFNFCPNCGAKMEEE